MTKAQQHKIVETLAERWKGPLPDWEDPRDWVDLRTGSDLDNIKLNILTDMVMIRLKRERTDV